MSADANRSQWASLAPCPIDDKSMFFGFMTLPLLLNNNELLIIPYANYDDSLYKYNINDNKWMKWIKYPNDWDSEYHTASLNKDKTILYIFNSDRFVFQINLKTKQFIKSSRQRQSGLFSSSLFIAGQFRIFGGVNYNSKSNFVWNEKEETLKKINDTDITKHDLTLHSMVYVPSKESVVILPDHNNNFDYSIYLYSLITNKCDELSLNGVTRPWQVPSAVITRNQQFIIIFGTFDYIQILDLNAMTIKTSQIYLDQQGLVYAVMVSDDKMDEILVFGFIRKCWNNSQFEDIQCLPIHLIQLIGKWYCQETIHILGRGDGQIHCKINIDDILRE